MIAGGLVTSSLAHPADAMNIRCETADPDAQSVPTAVVGQTNVRQRTDGWELTSSKAERRVLDGINARVDWKGDLRFSLAGLLRNAVTNVALKSRLTRTCSLSRTAFGAPRFVSNVTGGIQLQQTFMR